MARPGQRTPYNKEKTNMVDFDSSSEEAPEATSRKRQSDPDIIIDDDASSGKTVLDALRSELKKEVRTPPIVLTVPGREGMSIKFDTNVDSGSVQMWRKQSQNKSMTDNFDGLKFSSLVIANKAEAIMYNGVTARTDDGNELNFKNQALLEMLSVHRALDAVRKLYGVDGHIFVAADEILRAAGYDSESQDQQADPTLVS